MFALLKTSKKAKENIKDRALSALFPSRGIETGERPVMGFKINEISIDIPERIGRQTLLRRLESAAEELSEAGADVCVTPELFEYGDFFLERGISPPGRGKLMRDAAAQIAEFATGEKRDKIAVYAHRYSPEFFAAVRTLATAVRYLSVYCGSRTDECVDMLWYNYGISAGNGTSAFRGADAGIFFDRPPDDMRGYGCKQIIYLGENTGDKTANYIVGAEFAEPGELSVFAGYDVQQLVHALYNCGALTGKLHPVRLLYGGYLLDN